MFPASVADQNILFNDFSAYLISTHTSDKSQTNQINRISDLNLKFIPYLNFRR